MPVPDHIYDNYTEDELKNERFSIENGASKIRMPGTENTYSLKGAIGKRIKALLNRALVSKGLAKVKRGSKNERGITPADSAKQSKRKTDEGQDVTQGAGSKSKKRTRGITPADSAKQSKQKTNEGQDVTQGAVSTNRFESVGGDGEVYNFNAQAPPPPPPQPVPNPPTMTINESKEPEVQQETKCGDMPPPPQAQPQAPPPGDDDPPPPGDDDPEPPGDDDPDDFDRNNFAEMLRRERDLERFGLTSHPHAFQSVMGGINVGLFVQQVQKFHPTLFSRANIPQSKAKLSKGIDCMLDVFGNELGITNRKTTATSKLKAVANEYIDIKVLIYAKIMNTQAKVGVTLDASALGLNVNNLARLLQTPGIFPQERPKYTAVKQQERPRGNRPAPRAYGATNAQPIKENYKNHRLPNYRRQDRAKIYTGSYRAPPRGTMRTREGDYNTLVKYNI